MELIVLNVGLDLGLLSPTLFTMFVVMAIVTKAFLGHNVGTDVVVRKHSWDSYWRIAAGLRSIAQ